MFKVWVSHTQELLGFKHSLVMASGTLQINNQYESKVGFSFSGLSQGGFFSYIGSHKVSWSGIEWDLA